MKSEAEKEAGALLLREYGQFFKNQHRDLVCIDGFLQTLETNKTFLPIQMLLEPKESIPIIDLVSSDNTLMTKVLGVLSSLCVEVLNLKKEAFETHIPFLSIYEEYKESPVTSQIQSICCLSAFVSRCDDTLRNLFSQLFALCTEAVINLSGVELHYIINHIGELFTIIVLLELLISNTSLARNWNVYYKNLQSYAHKTDMLACPEHKFKSILGAVENISSKIMKDNIVQNSLNNLLTLRAKLVDRSCSVVAAEFSQYVKLVIINLDKLVQEKPYMNNMYKCIKVNTLFVLNSYLFGSNDKKTFRSLVELNTKAHSIPVAGTTLWFPEQFLQRHASSLCASHGKLPQTMFKARQSYLNAKKSSISRDESHLLNICTQWILNVERIFNASHSQLSASEMNLHSKILLSSLDMASHAHYSLLNIVNLHVSLGVPLSKTVLMSIFHMLETTKAFKNALIRNYNAIVNSLNMIIQHLTFQALSTVQNIKKTVMSDKNYANQRLDELTCIVVAERALRGAATIERNVAAGVALSLLPDSIYPEDSRAILGTLLEKIYVLSNYVPTINQLCDSSWMFWHQNIVPIYLAKNFLTEPTEAFRLKYFFYVLEDCGVMLHKVDKQFGVSKSSEFLDNAKMLLDDAVLKSSSQQIETNLRLHIHSHLQLDLMNPFTHEMIKNSLLYMDNFRLLQTYISVIPSVEHYLSTMYYNLTTVVLSDWKTYGEMRQMATFKFRLTTVEDNLPTQTLEQGLDVLEIMRNIHIFVSKYLYNLNNQIFIEKSSNNKHLNSINIRHIANSIRTHGTGIMNTTVNFTYQFLKKKFYTFSQFMYDEHIKSRLIKDLKILKDNAATNGNVYNYRNAEKFNRGIRNLGLADDGQSYLDLFRDLISQIGNAMGYVRMIRSGGRHSCADATVFLPSLQVEKSFKSLSEDCNLNAAAIEAADNLDENITNLTSNFTKGTEYFKLLVDAFAPVFRNPKNIHLKNFFIIVPPLTLNFVEHLILAKDRMSKKNKVGAAFTDDGFAMGIAYILKLLDQDSNFESLHWFEAVWKHIAHERKLLEEQKSKGTVQLQQALALTEKKILTLEQEFYLLYYSLSSARIFFR